MAVPLIPFATDIYVTGKNLLDGLKVIIEVRKLLKGKPAKEIKAIDNRQIKITGQDNSTTIINYNDFKKDHALRAAEIVFVEQKKKNGPVEYHTVSADETMHDISQHCGIRLRALYRKNHMKYGTEATPGHKLYLQKNAPVY